MLADVTLEANVLGTVESWQQQRNRTKHERTGCPLHSFELSWVAGYPMPALKYA